MLTRLLSYTIKVEFVARVEMTIMFVNMAVNFPRIAKNPPVPRQTKQVIFRTTVRVTAIKWTSRVNPPRFLLFLPDYLRSPAKIMAKSRITTEEPTHGEIDNVNTVLHRRLLFAKAEQTPTNLPRVSLSLNVEVLTNGIGKMEFTWKINRTKTAKKTPPSTLPTV